MIALTSVAGAVLIAVDSFRSTQARVIAEWHTCALNTAKGGLERELTATNEVLVHSILSDCKRHYEKVVNKCGSENQCEASVQHALLLRLNSIRDELIWARDQAKKRTQIEAALRELEKVGVDLDDIKSFFRDAILDDLAEKQNAAAEAKVASDRDRERW